MSYPDITTTAFGPMSSMGVMTFGVGGLLPFPGRYLWVNEASGNDGQPGTANQPLGSLDAAYALCTSGNNDIVLFQGTQHRTTTLNWAKNNTHLIGLSAPSDNDRSRISITGTTFFTPLVNVTGTGCIFLNIATFYGFVDALSSVCWAEAGGRNYYGNCQLLGGGNATGAAQAGMRSLTVAGAGENLFNNCTIGLDTVVRATGANASLEFLSGTPRNIFRSSVFQMDTSLATNVHVKAGVGGIDRYALFDNCTFINAVESGSTTINAAISADVSAGGAILLQNPMSLGATALATAGPVYVIGNVPTAATSGIAIKAT